ncbi:MAG: hypothetical protein HWD59_08515 [Coxiellaceae bacterium]|nr:MAG: hypothetical protein HWD59_08515 [Coxiellaceae bacterium]
MEELAKSPEKPQASNNNNNVPSSTTTILQHTLVVASSPDLPALNIERAGNALKITGFNSVNDANKDDVKRGIKEGITALEFISSNVECSYIEDLLAGFPETKMDLKFVDSTIVGDKSDRNKSISLHSLAFQRCNVDKISFCRLVEAEGLSQVAIDKPFLLLKWGIINLIERKNKIRFVFLMRKDFCIQESLT